MSDFRYRFWSDTNQQGFMQELGRQGVLYRTDGIVVVTMIEVMDLAADWAGELLVEKPNKKDLRARRTGELWKTGSHDEDGDW